MAKPCSSSLVGDDVRGLAGAQKTTAQKLRAADTAETAVFLPLRSLGRRLSRWGRLRNTHRQTRREYIIGVLRR
jgi:hypothetical protein